MFAAGNTDQIDKQNSLPLSILVFERERERGGIKLAEKKGQKSLKDINVRYVKAFHDTILNPMI